MVFRARGATALHKFGIKPLKSAEIASNQPNTYHIWIDPELGRVALGLGHAAPLRLWLVAMQLTRLADGSGKVNRLQLRKSLKSYGIHYQRHAFNRNLREGQGVFWHISQDKHSIYLKSYEKLSLALTEQAYRESPNLIETNRIGQKFREISVAGHHADFEASLFACWLDYRQDYGLERIAYATLELLFNRSADTLRDWVKRSDVETIAGYTQYAGINEALIPTHASLYKTKYDTVHVTWRLPNRYRTQSRKERQHKITPRSVARKCRQRVEMLENMTPEQPTSGCEMSRNEAVSTHLTAHEPRFVRGGFARTGKRYFHSTDSTSKARKSALRHIQRHQDEHAAHHAFLGFKRRYDIYECVDIDQRDETRLRERDFKAGHTTAFASRQSSYRQYLQD